MKIEIRFLAIGLLVCAMACAHSQEVPVSEADAARLNKRLVREAVVFEPGTKEGAVVPDLSAPQLRAIWVPERVENNRLIEAHREWLLEGEVGLLGVPKPQKGVKE